MTSPSLWVVIAAYNEATVIDGVVANVRGAGYPVIVVDDGSSDTTGDIAEAAGALVVRHPINLGQGAALQSGLEFALLSGAGVIVTFDGDGQHRVADIEVLAAALKQHDADFALGSRFLGDTSNQPVSRRIMLKLATLFTRVTIGIGITDTHNGFRAMTKRGARAIKLRQNRMAHASEILDQIAHSGLKYVEAPVTVDYTAYSLAKGQKLSDAFMILMDLFARRLHR